MFKVSLRSLLSHKLRLTLTAIAIILGVTFVAGTLVLTDTIRNTFEGVLSNVDRGVAVQVKGATPATPSGRLLNQNLPLPESVLARVQKVSGVADAAGVVERSGVSLLQNGQVVGATGHAPMLGLNWISDSQLSSFELTAGTAPRAADDVVINARAATDGHLVVGQQIQVSYEASAAQTFVISGIATFGGQASIATEGFAIFTLPTAESLLEANHTFDVIDVSAQSGVTDLQLRDRVASALSGTGVQVQTGAQAASETEQNAVTDINEFIGTPLLVFAFVAVFVGSFLIANTFSILVAQRTQELALLRALGATRGQVFTEVITEAALTGVLASLVGFLLGILVADGLIHLVGSSAKLSVQLDALITSVLVGTIITVIAAALPARRATRIAPMAALREAQPEFQGLPRVRIAFGLLLFLGGTAGLLESLFTATATSGPEPLRCSGCRCSASSWGRRCWPRSWSARWPRSSAGRLAFAVLRAAWPGRTPGATRAAPLSPRPR